MTPTFYISGTGRSGTNILKEILSKHSHVASLPFEHRFTIDPQGIVDFYRNLENWSPYLAEAKAKSFLNFLKSLAKRDHEEYRKSIEIKEGIKNITTYPYYGWELNNWIPGYESFVNELQKSIVSFEYSASYPGSKALIENNKMYFYTLNKHKIEKELISFLEKCHSSIVQNQEKKMFVEDNTWSILFADSLEKLTPKSKMIHIVRDPRDVIASYIQQKWTPNHLEDCISYYTNILLQWNVIKKKTSPNYFLEIRFEDLINDFQHTLNQILSFMNIGVEDSMLDIDLSKSNIGRYKQAFATKEIDHLNDCLKPFLVQYNYIK